VVGGVFKLLDGQGIPLQVILQYFKDKNLVVDWEDLFKEVVSHGWNLGGFLTRVEESLGEIYGPRGKDPYMEKIVLLSVSKPIN